MRLKFLIAPLLFLVTACSTTGFIPTKTEYKLIKPDAALLDCPIISKENIPEPETLTDIQAAGLINDIYADNKICKNNMEALRSWYRSADSIMKEIQKK